MHETIVVEKTSWLSSLAQRIAIWIGVMTAFWSPTALTQETPVPSAPTWVDLLMPLVLVVATGALAWWLVRRRGSLLRGNGPMQLVQVLPVGPRERLLLVKIDERYFICGATPAQISLVAALDAAPGGLVEIAGDRPAV